jgi:hypothetical protein
MDDMAKADAEDRQLRLFLMVSGKVDPEVAFPELAIVVTDDEAPLPEAVDADGEPISTKYIFSNDVEYDPKKVEEMARVMAEMAAQAEASFDSPTYDEWQ